MGKLASLNSLFNSAVDSFVYTPPQQAFGAGRILVIADMVYPTHPPTGSFDVLGTILRGLRRASPKGRIVLLEGNYPEMVEVYTESALLDAEMRISDIDDLTMSEYSNPLENPTTFATLHAPDYLREFDCVISAATFKVIERDKTALISGVTHNLYGLLPREQYSNEYERDQLYEPYAEILQDVYATLKPFIHGGVVDVSYKFVSPILEREQSGNVAIGRVLWGTDLPVLDTTACRISDERPDAGLSALT